EETQPQQQRQPPVRGHRVTKGTPKPTPHKEDVSPRTQTIGINQTSSGTLLSSQKSDAPT
ncbi:hypothetical protein, partial [Jiangella rhizosphaerae]|uniref:hypothetical protein n=1 Tax=Jiangella rhizosphaerae TaxID=2293569 RepID=UPI001F195FB6